MPIVIANNLEIAFGGPVLLARAGFSIDAGERIGLVGRNGVGKSTLLKLLAGKITPDDGTLRWHAGARVALLSQDVPQVDSGSVFDVVAEPLGPLAGMLREYDRFSHDLSDAVARRRLDAIEREIETADGWRIEQRVERVIDRLSLPAGAEFNQLSGGLKRRVLLARALVEEPDLLLLDEPTNHLDIAAIEWLEAFLVRYAGAVLLVTHDRRFLARLATRVLEIDRGRLMSWQGDYANFLRRKTEQLAAEDRQVAEFDKRIAEEERWLRRGVTARRSRNQGRLRRLDALRAERRERRERIGQGRIDAPAAGRSGRIVIEAEALRFGYGSEQLVDNFSSRIQRGDKVGIIGANGSGKTTLLRLLLGQQAPDAGQVRLGSSIEIAYFDQHREQLDPALNVQENVAGGREQIHTDAGSKHVISYLGDFLFTPERARAPIHALSGGERGRLLLARLFASPSNLLVMDEPTNDLDIETLELLEELLVNYTGTLLLVSHDRAFLDNVVTSVIAFEAGGRIAEYVGGYEDWLRQRPAPIPAAAMPASQATPRPRAAGPPRKLSYRLKRELDALPGRIEALEAELHALEAEMAQADFYRRERAAIAAGSARLGVIREELNEAYARWQELEAVA